MSRLRSQLVDRRRFLAYGGAAVAGAAALQIGVLALSDNDEGGGGPRAYFLDPRGDPAAALCLGDRSTGPTCVACRACQRHATNRLYMSADEADGGRAHPNCNCTVRAFSLSSEEHFALFGSGVRQRFDQRRDRMLADDVEVANVMQRTAFSA
jgi:hypothetical protein